MQQLWDYTYSLLQAEIQLCLYSESTEAEQAEYCFQTALKYWLRVKAHWQEKIHITEEEEILFFRVIKPKFTSEIEYYLILNQGLLFIPIDRLGEYEYWRDEKRRYKRFYERNADFINYFESNQRFRDIDYFLQE